MGPGRAGNAHKLSGAAGCNLSSVVLEGSSRCVCTVTARQSDSCSIYQQPGRHSLSTADKTCEGSMDVGSTQGYCDCAEHIPGITNYVVDAESRTRTDQTDWSLRPEIFREINQQWGPLEVDLFASCLSNQLP